MVEESLAPGASVIEVARRHDVHPNLLTVWRRQARTGAFGAAPTLRPEGELQFAAVSVTPEQPAWTVHAGGTIEIAFASGAQLRITGAVDPATLTAAVLALSGERAR